MPAARAFGAGATRVQAPRAGGGRTALRFLRHGGAGRRRPAHEQGPDAYSDWGRRLLSVPKTAAGGKSLLVDLPPSTPTTAPTETHRSRPAPCSWGGSASNPSQRHWLPALLGRPCVEAWFVVCWGYEYSCCCRKTVGGARYCPRAGGFPAGRWLPHGQWLHRNMGAGPPRLPQGAGRIGRALSPLAHGRSAHFAGGHPLEGAARHAQPVRHRQKVDERQGHFRGHLRNGRGARGRADLPLHLPHGGLQKAGQAAVDLVDDRRGHPQGL